MWNEQITNYINKLLADPDERLNSQEYGIGLGSKINKKPETVSAFCNVLKLCFIAKRKIPCITQPRYDISFCRQFVINGPTPDFTCWQRPANVFNSNGTGNGSNDMNLSRVAFCTQLLNG